MKPDVASARPRLTDLERAPSIARAQELLFTIFDPFSNSPAKRRLNLFIEQYRAYPLDERSIRHASTDLYTPDTPLIKPAQIADATEIVTITIGHHYLGWGPDHDLVVAKYKGNPELRSYWFQKRQNPEIEPKFTRVFDWTPVRRLLLDQPAGRWGTGARIVHWKKDEFAPHYNFVSGLSTHGLSLLQFLGKLETG